MYQLVVRLLLHKSLDLVIAFHNGIAKRRAQLERLVRQHGVAARPFAYWASIAAIARIQAALMVTT